MHKYIVFVAFFTSAIALSASSKLEKLLIVEGDEGCIDATYFIPEGKYNDVQKKWLQSIITYIDPALRSGKPEYRSPKGGSLQRTTGEQLLNLSKNSEFQKWLNKQFKAELNQLFDARTELLKAPKNKAEKETNFQNHAENIDNLLKEVYSVEYQAKNMGPGCLD